MQVENNPNTYGTITKHAQKKHTPADEKKMHTKQKHKTHAYEKKI